MNPFLSVIVIFFNMRREAKRTLRSLTADYQRDIDRAEYEILVIDNGSPEPLDPDFVRGHGNTFHYHFERTNSPSPCAAINEGVRRAKAENVVVVIDGARILSPGILGLMKRALGLYVNPFIYTLAMHLGPDIQNRSLAIGYGQQVENEMLSELRWETNGYRLFKVSTVAPSSGKGFWSPLAESNCMALSKKIFFQLGGFCEAFHAPGGGLANADCFQRVSNHPAVQPVMLLGEATFHQYHGGVATNSPLEEHPWDAFAAEYRRVRGVDFASGARRPVYFGSYREECRELYAVDL